MPALIKFRMYHALFQAGDFLPANSRNKIMGTRHVIYAQSNLNNVPSLSSPCASYTFSLLFTSSSLSKPPIICVPPVKFLYFLLLFLQLFKLCLSLDYSMAVLVNIGNAITCLALVVSVAASPCQKRGAGSGAMVPAVANNSTPMTSPVPVDTPASTNTPVPTSNPATPNMAVSANTPASANLCGNDQHIIIDGTPWLVANSMYGAAQMVGSVCTQFDRVETPAGGNPRIVWGSKTAIEYVESTSVLSDSTAASNVFNTDPS